MKDMSRSVATSAVRSSLADLSSSMRLCLHPSGPVVHIFTLDSMLEETVLVLVSVLVDPAMLVLDMVEPNVAPVLVKVMLTLVLIGGFVKPVMLVSVDMLILVPLVVVVALVLDLLRVDAVVAMVARVLVGHMADTSLLLWSASPMLSPTTFNVRRSSWSSSAGCTSSDCCSQSWCR